MWRRREVGRRWYQGHGEEEGRKENFEDRIAGWELHLEGLVSTCVAHGHCVIALSLDDAASAEIYCQNPGVCSVSRQLPFRSNE
jgi:hypothetical protein